MAEYEVAKAKAVIPCCPLNSKNCISIKQPQIKSTINIYNFHGINMINCDPIKTINLYVSLIETKQANAKCWKLRRIYLSTQLL